MNIGCANPGFYPPAPAAGFQPYAGYGNPYALAPLGGWDIVGADPVPAPQKTFMEKTKDFLAEESIGGIKNGYLLGGAAAIGAIWWAYSAGYFGK